MKERRQVVVLQLATPCTEALGMGVWCAFGEGPA